MLIMKELRELIKNCIEELDSFSSTELKELLKDKGYTYNIDYNVTSFSNAISSLIKQKYITFSDTHRKGHYKVIKNNEYDYKNTENTYNKTSEETCHQNKEPDLAEMRKEITTLLNSTLQKIENRIDQEKPSTYFTNIKTYTDIARLVETLKDFKFTIKDE